MRKGSLLKQLPMPGKILFLVPYPIGAAPSQRFRFEQYLDVLNAKGFTVRVHSFLNTQNWKIFYEKGRVPEKIATIAAGFMRRLLILLSVRSYDFIFVHREVTPIGPPLCEWLIVRLLGKKIIYDFDDAIWLPDNPDESAVLGLLKWRRKVQRICAWSHKVSCGNRYLQTFAGQFNDSAIINPTTIDTKKHVSRTRHASDVYIGWTGTHSTLKYLHIIEHELRKLQDTFDHVWLIVIADRKPELVLPRLLFVPWCKATEIEDLNKIDIGIMPLNDSEWEKGKCGFKALQYMALEIPSVISAVGMNTDLVINGENGFLASTGQEWYNALELLINDKDLRRRIGSSGRARILSDYSVQSNTANFLSLFE